MRLAIHLLTALGLVFILEGMGPFVVPSLWRSAMQRMAEISDLQLRIVGLAAKVSGLTVVFMAQ